MSFFGVIILALAAGFVIGVLTALFAWIVPLRCERENLKTRLRKALDSQWAQNFTPDGYRRHRRATDRKLVYEQDVEAN